MSFDSNVADAGDIALSVIAGSHLNLAAHMLKTSTYSFYGIIVVFLLLILQLGTFSNYVPGFPAIFAELTRLATSWLG